MTWLYLTGAVGVIASAPILSVFAPPASAAEPVVTTTADAREPGAVTNDIVVTAQRRSERLQDVPVSISAITPGLADSIGIRTVKDIEIAAPGTSIGNGVSYAQVYVRGIGSIFVNPGLESPVALYLDGVYLQRNRGVADMLNLYDAGSIQVLRGPQGTLYGRNATGGALLVASADPKGEFEGRIAAEYGNLDHKQLDAMVNIPLAETLSLRVAGRYLDEDGFVKNRRDGTVAGGRKIYGVRGKLRWQPSAATDVLLTVEYDKTRRGADIGSLSDVGRSCLLCAPSGITTRPGFYEHDVNGGKKFRGKSFTTNLRTIFEFDQISITNIIAYRYDKEISETDQDFTPISAFNFTVPASGGKTFSNDFQLSSNLDGHLNYLMGLYYLRDKGNIQVQFSGTSFPPVAGAPRRAFNKVTTESISGFVELYYAFTSELKATIGGRYTYDHRTADVVLNAGFGGPLSRQQRASFSAFTPRFVLSWDNGPVNVYYSFSRGFKAGGLTSPATTVVAAPPLKPEKVFSHEVGVKSSALGGRLRTNLALFYYKSSNLQTSIINTAGGGTLTQNAGGTRAYGVEADANLEVADGLRVGVTGAFLDAQYTDFPNAVVRCLDTSSSPLPALFNCGQNLKGFPLPRAPKVTASLMVGYDFSVGSWSANLAGAARYQSKVYFSPGAGGIVGLPVSLAGTGRTSATTLGHDVQDGYTVVNISGYLSPPGGKMRFGFYVDNLLDKKYANFKQSSAPFGLVYAPAKPITYGVRASYQL